MNNSMIDATRLNTSTLGTSKVTLAYIFNGDTLFTSYNINIVAFVTKPISLSLDITSADVLIDQLVNLKYIVEPSNANYSNVVWTSSNPLVASVDNNGLVTAKNIGEVLITATLDNNLTASARLNFKTPPAIDNNQGNLAPVQIDTEPPTAELVGDASITHERGTPFNDPGVTMSDDIDNNPQLTIVSEFDENLVGEYTISYTASDSSGNETTINRTVFVTDTLNPTISNFSVNYTNNSQGVLNFTLNENSTYFFIILLSSVAEPNAATIKGQTATYKGTGNGVFGLNQINFTVDNIYRNYSFYLVANDMTNDSSISKNQNLLSISIPISTPQELNYIRATTDGGANGITFSNGTPSDPTDDVVISFSPNTSNAFNALRLNYHLVNDINLSGSGAYAAIAPFDSVEKRGWVPIGYSGTLTAVPYRGLFDGNNYTISNIAIKTDTVFGNRVGNTGLFSSIDGATIKNLKVDVDFLRVGLGTGDSSVGALVAIANNSTIENVETTGIITNGGEGLDLYSGMIGFARGTIVITKSSSRVKIITRIGGGGLIGRALDGNSDITINESYNAGDITSSIGRAGGLVSHFNSGASSKLIIRNSYNSGNIDSYDAGGLIYISSGAVKDTITLSNTYNSGLITGNSANDVANLIYSANENVTVTNLLVENSLFLVNGVQTAFNDKILSDTLVRTGRDRTLEQLKDIATYDSWTLFGTFWEIDPTINNGLPHLKNNFILIPPQV
jgi:hypothetical protein